MLKFSLIEMPAPAGFIALLFDSRTATRRAPAKARQPSRSRPDRLLCHLCRAVITDSQARIEKLGRHVHQRTNPAGFHFEFGCFQQAPGCTAMGEAVSDFSWFPEYRWQVLLCRECDEHLGWLFRGSDRFFGLILNRLVSMQ